MDESVANRTLDEPPPWMNSHTGNIDSSVALAGAHTLTYKQSSSWKLLFGYGTEMPRQMGPNWISRPVS